MPEQKEGVIETYRGKDPDLFACTQISIDMEKERQGKEKKKKKSKSGS